jgi:DMSO/TMAO reductase YedYZ heme-binding membrane subunit
VTLIGGGGAYVLLAAMVATSNDASVRALGIRTWKRLHTVGLYWLWFIFAFSYLGRVAEGQIGFVWLLAASLAGLGLRIAARIRHRRG